jgi:hypothetical protein
MTQLVHSPAEKRVPDRPSRDEIDRTIKNFFQPLRQRHVTIGNAGFIAIDKVHHHIDVAAGSIELVRRSGSKEKQFAHRQITTQLRNTRHAAFENTLEFFCYIDLSFHTLHLTGSQAHPFSVWLLFAVARLSRRLAPLRGNTSQQHPAQSFCIHHSQQRCSRHPSNQRPSDPPTSRRPIEVPGQHKDLR